MESSKFSTCKTDISVSTFTRKKLPDLKKIFQSIEHQKYTLEIVGVAKVGVSEAETILSVALRKKTDVTNQRSGELPAFS